MAETLYHVGLVILIIVSVILIICQSYLIHNKQGNSVVILSLICSLVSLIFSYIVTYISMEHIPE